MKRCVEISKKIKMINKYKTTGRLNSYTENNDSDSSSSSFELSDDFNDDNENENKNIFHMNTNYSAYNINEPNIYKNFASNTNIKKNEYSHNRVDAFEKEKEKNYDKIDETEDNKNESKTEVKNDVVGTPILKKKISLFSFDEPENKKKKGGTLYEVNKDNNNNSKDISNNSYNDNKINILYKNEKAFDNITNKFELRKANFIGHKKNQTEINLAQLRKGKEDLGYGENVEEIGDTMSNSPNLSPSDFLQKRKFTFIINKTGKSYGQNTQNSNQSKFINPPIKGIRKKSSKENKPKELDELKDLWSYNKIILNDGALDFCSKK